MLTFDALRVGALVVVLVAEGAVVAFVRDVVFVRVGVAVALGLVVARVGLAEAVSRPISVARADVVTGGREASERLIPPVRERSPLDGVAEAVDPSEAGVAV
ncbi:MAG: hypothetical protein L0I04_12065, partial [Acidipropionibacterium jensenii]|uniref:hypothetical protein n=2 Tax=Acidipropionibacterium jensenii TaxID=1749 RepID=UPI00264A3A2A